jgi:hypothetical protein
MSKVKSNPVVAIVVFFGAILAFSQSAGLFSKSNSTQNALRPTTVKGQVLIAEGTVPPPVRPPSSKLS